jgi:type I restriction enzyme M protein
LGNVGRNGGGYYAPRPLIRNITLVVNPHIGEHIYNGTVASAEFLDELFDYLRKKPCQATGDANTTPTILPWSVLRGRLNLIERATAPALS